MTGGDKRRLRSYIDALQDGQNLTVDTTVDDTQALPYHNFLVTSRRQQFSV